MKKLVCLRLLRKKSYLDSQNDKIKQIKKKKVIRVQYCSLRIVNIASDTTNSRKHDFEVNISRRRIFFRNGVFNRYALCRRSVKSIEFQIGQTRIKSKQYFVFSLFSSSKMWKMTL